VAGETTADLRRAAHLVGEGVKGLTVSPGQTLACVLSLAVATCLVTLFTSFGSVAVSMLERAGQKARIIVYLKDAVPTGDVEALLAKVRAHPDVGRAEYLSREQDRARNAALLPRDVVARLAPEAVPGQHCVEVDFRDDPKRTPDVAGLGRLVRELSVVDVVAEPPVGAARLRAAAAALGFARAVLTLVAVLLLANTVFFVVGTLTRTMERRRDEMALLRLLGATEVFVKTPLYVQGVLQGVLGVGSGAVAGVLVVAATNTYLAESLSLGISVPSLPGTIVGLGLLGGALVGALGAWLASMRRVA
jgi:cell division transport system permease protein